MTQIQKAKRTARRRPQDDVAPSPLDRLRQLVETGRDKTLDAFARGDRLVYRCEGLRIYQRPDGSFRAVESLDYVGPPAELFLETLYEREIEREALAAIESATDEERAAALDEYERHMDGLRQMLEDR